MITLPRVTNGCTGARVISGKQRLSPRENHQHRVYKDVARELLENVHEDFLVSNINGCLPQLMTAALDILRENFCLLDFIA